MRILVLSDSHGRLSYMERAIAQTSPDFFIHLGDHYCDAQELLTAYPKLPHFEVAGNCDWTSFGVPDTMLRLINAVPILLTHGHRFGVKRDLLRAVCYAREKQAKILLYGHTHQAHCEYYSGLWILNPGACNGYGRASCGVIEIENDSILCYNQDISDEETKE